MRLIETVSNLLAKKPHSLKALGLPLKFGRPKPPTPEQATLWSRMNLAPLLKPPKKR